MTNDAVLVEIAKKAQGNAYCPYSGYAVGAAVLGADGSVHAGSNVENASIGLTLCAERVALANMASAGCRQVRAVAVATKDGATPCGACRQFIAEFCSDPSQVRVIAVDGAGRTATYTLAELLPHSFAKASLDARQPSADQPLGEP